MDRSVNTPKYSGIRYLPFAHYIGVRMLREFMGAVACVIEPERTTRLPELEIRRLVSARSGRSAARPRSLSLGQQQTTRRRQYHLVSIVILDSPMQNVSFGELAL
jgi:hypothetical protein